MSNKIVPSEMQWHEGKVKNFFGKELLQMDNGTVKIVKVAPFAHYPDHLHPDKTEYIYVLTGKPHFRIGEEIFYAAPNEFYIFPAKLKHAIINETDAECTLLVGAVFL